jgi:hypothetical protein
MVNLPLTRRWIAFGPEGGYYMDPTKYILDFIWL